MFKQPLIVQTLLDEAKKLHFSMSCDLETGSILRTLAASKPESNILEIGTGVGVSTSWILEGMDTNSNLISIEMDKEAHQIAKQHLGKDERVTFVTMDGSDFIKNNKDKKFELIFADSWPGKFYDLEETLGMLKKGGIYLIDDLTPAENWPEEHGPKVDHLKEYLSKRDDLQITPLDWSTGLIIAVKK
ncbi:O-methyltransferase [Chengkuizengella axinellae]|uniref:Class I SAM-dependent methyltransferase n=1 Tax=Chengkuizengella axinellae TaxID=3064388 RepID=A0ABT9IY51_9BACL|nr:class I SAM-dependent methyltransferase [Chengkuizengella sp. 2205SS18-9]MDP5274291.1 class I SAM-dependent methyltransferase [Chengkuizengella sp. 2205SS18-9]